MFDSIKNYSNEVLNAISKLVEVNTNSAKTVEKFVEASLLEKLRFNKDKERKINSLVASPTHSDFCELYYELSDQAPTTKLSSSTTTTTVCDLEDYGSFIRKLTAGSYSKCLSTSFVKSWREEDDNKFILSEEKWFIADDASNEYILISFRINLRYAYKNQYYEVYIDELLTNKKPSEFTQYVAELTEFHKEKIEKRKKESVYEKQQNLEAELALHNSDEKNQNLSVSEHELREYCPEKDDFIDKD